MRRLALAAWVILAGMFLPGCASTSDERALREEAHIGEIHLFTMPMALNLDRFPGADGFAVKIYAIDKAHPKSVTITSGSLEILMYNGVLAASSLSTNTPLSTWRFDAAELAAFAHKTSVGVVYGLTPTWRDQKPCCEKITVTACYAPPDHKAGQRRVCSLPTTVTVSLPSSFR